MGTLRLSGYFYIPDTLDISDDNCSDELLEEFIKIFQWPICKKCPSLNRLPSPLWKCPHFKEEI